jgi:hypothetical protein
MRIVTFFCLVIFSLCQSACFQVKAKEPVVYKFEHGRTALLRDGLAYAPKNAPKAVIKAIAAGNRLQGKPYKWGGGHACFNDTGYDCSGTCSYVLREAGLINGCLTSRGFLDFGKRGEGKWITLYSRNGHVFMTVAGLRLDTGGDGSHSGPKWKPWRRGVGGYIMRHPSGY